MTLNDLKSEFSHAYVRAVAHAAGYFVQEAKRTFDGDGPTEVSDALAADTRAVLGLQQPLRVRGLADCRRGYLPWHRQRVQPWTQGRCE